ncbi:MAG: hypothetical protein JXR88_06545 [Clostridia bacterium]|nr:hypothetical protein [Clostridia bacterium]
MYFIGVDGGGTQSTYVLMKADKTILKQCQSTGTNISSHGEAYVRNSLKQGIEKLLEDFNVSCSNIPICLASAGVDQPSDVKVYENILKDLGFHHMKVVNDGEGALSAGTKGEDGIIAIAGTGSVVIGKKNNVLKRTGGWGHILGDEGSAYSIAISGIKAVLQTYDGYGAPTSLTKGLLEAISGKECTDFIGFIYQQNLGKDQIAKLAQVVDDHANRGDEIAKRIISNEAEKLFRQIKSIQDELFENEKCLLVLNGSVVKKSLLFRKELRRLLDSKVRMIDCEDSAAIGAAYLAKQMEDL